MRSPNTEGCEFEKVSAQSIGNGLEQSVEVYRLAPHLPQGFYIICGSISADSQLRWAETCCERYSKEEHNNLSNLAAITEGARGCRDEDLWAAAVAEGDGFKRFHKLRWSCLGYHYDWTNRKYEKSLKSAFPEELATLSRALAALVGMDLSAEAAICNYYPQGSYMSGHVDDAEHNMSEPIVSVSLGRSALFLLGGRTRAEQPIPIRVRSGDVLVMGGESRYSFHGVPYVFSREEDEEYELLHGLECALGDGPSNPGVRDFLADARINLNVRRVRVGEQWLCEKQGSGYRHGDK